MTSALVTALKYLIENWGNLFDPHTVLDADVNNAESIWFRIHRKYNKQLTNYPDPENFSVRKGNPISIAALIIHQHGSELTITPDDEGVTFAFELPVWSGDEI